MAPFISPETGDANPDIVFPSPTAPNPSPAAVNWVKTPNHSCQCSSINSTPQKDQACLAAKLCQVMRACAVVPKDKENAQQRYKYASSDAILEKVNPALVDAGLATVCLMEVIDRQPRTTNSGGMWELVTVRCRISIIDTATGATIETEGVGQGFDGGDKSLSKAQTQARKYAWMLALNISTGEDPEGDDKTPTRSWTPPAVCRKCGGPAAYAGTGEYEGQPVQRYCCEKCKTETRVKA